MTQKKEIEFFDEDDPRAIRLWNSEEVGNLLGVSRQTVLNWAKRGTLPGIKLGDRVIRFDPTSLDFYLSRSRIEQLRDEVDPD
jgi:excisionase family DNA binding protein